MDPISLAAIVSLFGLVAEIARSSGSKQKSKKPVAPKPKPALTIAQTYHEPQPAPTALDEKISPAVAPAAATVTTATATEVKNAPNFILTIAISDSEAELIDVLKAEDPVYPDVAERIFKAREWIHYSSEDVWNTDCQNLFDPRPADEDDSIGSVCYVKILAGTEKDDRFEPGSNMMKMYDALKNLFQDGPPPAISVSPPRSRRTYENKGFFRV